MEDLTPPLLIAIREIQWRISAGKSMREATNQYLATQHDAFAQQLRERWLIEGQNRQPKPLDTHLQRALWELIQRGCKGQPILEPLKHLEDEVEKAAEHELEMHLASLPFKILIPMLFLNFPAYLLLLLAPMLRELSRMSGG